MSAPADLPLDVTDEPIIGWRTWFVLPDELLLRPIFMRGLAWKPRQTLEAVCPENLHAVPADGCKCGVWGVCHPMLLKETLWRTTPPDGIDPLPGVLVVGQIAMWGNVVQHDRGWRSSHAYPRHLYVFTDDALVAEGLRERYGVPVAYGEQATPVRRFLPTRFADAATAPAAARASAPAPKRRSELLHELVVAPLPDGPVKALAETRLSEYAWLVNYCGDEAGIARKRESVVRARTPLRRAIARGGYRVEAYGAAWETVVRQKLKVATAELGLQIAVQRAERGDATAARRAVWLLMALRWHDAIRAYQRVVRAEHANRTRGIRGERAGKKLARTTIERRRNAATRAHADLQATLQWLVDTPTPAYREWIEILDGKR